MTPEQLDAIEKLARDPKSAAFHDLMARQTIPLVKALREAWAIIDHYQRKDGPIFQAHLAEADAMRERDEARAVADQCKDTIAVLREQAVELRAEVERLREALQEIAEGDCYYGDNCPSNAGTRHGTCTECKARQALKEGES